MCQVLLKAKDNIDVSVSGLYFLIIITYVANRINMSVDKQNRCDSTLSLTECFIFSSGYIRLNTLYCFIIL